MERQVEGNVRGPASVRRLIEGGARAGRLEGKLEGFRKGQLDGKRDALLRLLARAGVTLAEGDRARLRACSDVAILDRWIDNVLGAKTAADVLT